MIPSGGASDPKCLPGCGSLALALSDDQREQLIHACYQSAIAESDPEQQRRAFDRMRELIAQRSPEQIAKLEKERGLTR
jgi:hypothetical protein